RRVTAAIPVVRIAGYGTNRCEVLEHRSAAVLFRDRTAAPHRRGRACNQESRHGRGDEHESFHGSSTLGDRAGARTRLAFSRGPTRIPPFVLDAKVATRPAARTR